ncbi:MAG: hypothetical protein GY749_16615 [Desulfobacteraceae bacterium]|nr:hypothetical protein [Desulfobacteraceae bacterium]
MRRFHSYGPVNVKRHFTVPRKMLIDSCLENLVGDPDEGGHYFTIWAPRQTGKTWLMQQVTQEIEARYKDRFTVYNFSLGRLRGMNYKPSEDSEELNLPSGLTDVLEGELPGSPCIKTWNEFYQLFSIDIGIWERPLILFIDEIDTTPPLLLDIIVNQFREMYLKPEKNRIHGLALIGVRAVLGVESDRGSPFNIQRSLHVPNLTREEVKNLYQQYQEESGQTVEQDVVKNVFKVTRGQPGLVCWFGELMAEKYNPGAGKPINMTIWKTVYRKACYTEWNNTVLNLVKKAKAEYLPHVLDLFTRPDRRFSLDADWCSYLYLNGIIDTDTKTDPGGEPAEVCRFSSPFIQERVYNALTSDLIGDRMPILALEPLDDLADVFENPELNLPALLERYKSYLKRLKARGLNPWKDQPRRTDMHLTEAVGHFHLYAWLLSAVGRQCTVSPEFPTGNGRVDLHLRCGEKRGLIEVKSFINASEAKEARGQAAKYAKQTGLNAVTIALFTPVEDESVLEELSVEEEIDGVRVLVVAIGWM